LSSWECPVSLHHFINSKDICSALGLSRPWVEPGLCAQLVWGGELQERCGPLPCKPVAEASKEEE
jgi:hypothetical protein